MEVVASLSQGRTAAAQCGLFTYKSVPVVFEPPCRNGCCSPSPVYELQTSQILNRRASYSARDDGDDDDDDRIMNGSPFTSVC